MISVSTDVKVLRLTWEENGRRAGIKYVHTKTGTKGFFLNLRDEHGRFELKRYNDFAVAVERGNAFLCRRFNLALEAKAS